jgi:hypothetical protein
VWERPVLKRSRPTFVVRGTWGPIVVGDALCQLLLDP